MVHMHPPEYDQDTPESEKVIFNALKNASGADDWHVFHSLKLHAIKDRAEGEADFVVLIPNQGMIVIEAKNPTGLRGTHNGWELEGVPEKSKKPVVQLDTIRSELNDYLKRKYGNLFPLARVLWLTRLTYEQLAPVGHGDMQIEIYEVLGKDALSTPIDSLLEVLVQFQKQAGPGQGFADFKQFNGGTFKMYLDALSKNFIVNASAADQTEARQDELDEYEFGDTRLYRAVASNKNVLIDGPAGTGKSGYLRQFAMDAEGKVLLLSWSDLVTEYNEREFGDAFSDLHVKDFGKFMKEISGAEIRAGEDNDDFYSHRLPLEAIAALPNSEFGDYDLIAIDEFQDIAGRPDVLKFVEALAKGPKFENTRLILAGDVRQQIMRPMGQSRVEDLEAVAKSLCGFVSKLDLHDNFRNSPEVGAAIDKVLGAKRPTYDRFAVNEGRGGVEVHEVTTGTAANRLRDTLSELMDDFEPHEIRVLSPYNEKKSIAGYVLRSKGNVPSPVWRELQMMLKDGGDGSGSIPWRSITKFKGRESQAVVVTDISVPDHYRTTPEAQQERIEHMLELLYVAISRANYRVVIFCDEIMAKVLKELGF